MIDFGPLLQNPFMLLFGAAAQFGIFFVVVVAVLFGFDIREAASIGIIGAADGPTSIFVANQLAPSITWSDYGCGLLIHGTCSDYPTNRYQDGYNKSRTSYSYDIPRFRRI